MTVSPRTMAAAAALALMFAALHAGAQPLDLPANAPLPAPRPQIAPGQAAMTSAVLPDAEPLVQDDLAVLRQGLDALSQGDAATARQVRDQLEKGSLDQHILSWAIAMSNAPGVPSGDIADAASTLSDWPGKARLRANSERALYRQAPTAHQVIAAFGTTKPTTFEGTVALARAHLALEDRVAAKTVLVPFWREQKLQPREESVLIKEFGQLLSGADHRHRMERMLYEERVQSAQRVAPLGDSEALAKAWSAVIRNERNAEKLLDAVPEAQRSAGYYFAKARYLRRTNQFEQAASALLSAPKDPAAQIDADEWWFERRALSRELLDVGDPATAYRIVNGHVGGSTVSRVDAQFHAGWYALRNLKDPDTASRHFAAIPDLADGPISKARGYYWLGRAADAGGPGNAVAYYQQAAVFGTAFYGQLAAARLGRPTIPLASPEPSELERKNFVAREAVRAIERLQSAGYERHAQALYRDLAQELESAGELALLAAMAEQQGNHYLALRLAKIAASRGLDIGALTHPVGAIPEQASISGAGKALAYAIARQESEFNVAAVSSAGARGLLQLMPATARTMAQKSGLPFSAPRLTADAGYNATLGAAYLSEQLERFDGSYILTFVGYNAGPRRAEEWMERYGDPRGKPIEVVVDWIERIPYTETRNYVQRVLENYQVYKMRLTGRADIAEDLVNGRR